MAILRLCRRNLEERSVKEGGSNEVACFAVRSFYSIVADEGSSIILRDTTGKTERKILEMINQTSAAGMIDALKVNIIN